jgi:dihydrodipicolinate synthase/N-acetylneuraminate lyase
MHKTAIPTEVLASFKKGVVIPALPLALNKDRTFDPRRERALVRYYTEAGVGGLAVGVHSTQFAIRDPKINLYETVLNLASKTLDEQSVKLGRKLMKIAGVIGKTPQALKEAEFAGKAGYHAVLLGLGAWAKDSVDDMVAHCKAVSEVMPVIGFYLQPAAGGRLLPYEFWRKFGEIDNVVGIKMAPFNRYQTFDVLRGICEAGRENDIAMYTGNDDNIVVDLLSPYQIKTAKGEKTIRIMGGLLGHWGVWTKKAAEMLTHLQSIRDKNGPIPMDIMVLANQVTDMNAVLFDAANGFHGCIPGIHEVLRRQGLLENILTLDPNEKLSPGQAEELDRVCAAYPHLIDDQFVKQNLQKWLGDESAAR